MTSRSQRRIFTWVIIMMLLMLFARYTSAASVSTPVPSVKSSDVTLKVGSTRPYKTTNRFSDYWYNVLSEITTHDNLIRFSTDMRPVPWIATSWEISPDSKTFVFTITDKAKWHDGKILTAADVQFSIEYYRDKDPQAGWMKDVIGSVQVERNRVVVKLLRPYGNLLPEFLSYPILPKHIWEKVSDPLKYEGPDRVIGSGPLKFVSWDQAAGRFLFEATPDHFQGKPRVKTVEVNVFRNMDALVMALSKGVVDTWWDYSGEFPYTHVPPLLKSGNVKFASATFLGVPAALGFNLDRYPMNGLPFRQAVALAINYEQIANFVYSGYGTIPTYGFSPPTHANFNPTLPKLEYSPERARGLLDSLGLKDADGDGIREGSDGKNISLSLLARSDTPGLMRTAELIKDNLKNTGIEVQIKAVDSSTWTALKDKMAYDMALFRSTPWGMITHAGHGSTYFDGRRTGAGVLHNFNAKEYLDICDARLATALPDEQKKLDIKLQELHSQHLPGIALVWIESLYPYREGWSNWTIDNIFGGVVNSFSWSKVTKSAK